MVTLEGGVLEGGYGQMLASYLGNSNLKTQNYGFEKAFYDHYSNEYFLDESGITIKNIVKNILAELGC